MAKMTICSGFSLPINSYLNNAIGGPNDLPQGGHGDARIFSGDGCEFSVQQGMIDRVSLPLSQRWVDAPNDPADPTPSTTMNLLEDGEVVLALLLACYDQAFIPIESIDLAEAFVKAAQLYQVPLPSPVFAGGFFSPRAIADIPLRYCALAWSTGLPRQVIETSRYALSQKKLQGAVEWARKTVGGEEVLLALALTKLDRESQIDTVVTWLPMNIMCASCQAEGRNTYSEMRETVEEVFERPYPDLYSIVDPLTWVSSSLSDNCRRNTCGTRAGAYRFDEEDIFNTIRAAAGVRQTIDPIYLSQNLQERLRV